jgi:hypothetical protein
MSGTLAAFWERLVPPEVMEERTYVMVGKRIKDKINNGKVRA